ncbi:hypothetical protein [Burkholderia gladioli]|uniref:hypothetical protein n=1 Tax=Burkholderia gladioli TaxID=28095 RepID=UPI00163DF0A2|nr:hypothetical protein [Burkholderia gladioli]
MKLFLIVLVAAFALTLFGQVVQLGAGKIPPRTPATVTLDIFCNAAFLIWAVILLARSF